VVYVSIIFVIKLYINFRHEGITVLFRSLAVLNLRVGHTMDVLSPFIFCPLSSF